MGKEFIEYSNETGKTPYSGGTVCRCLTQYARDYVSENREIISRIDKDVRDAVLVDVINWMGTNVGMNFGLYTSDLFSGRKDYDYVDAQYLLTILQNFYAKYIFEIGIVESVLNNKHMNECKEEFDANDGAIILVDFINYVAERNDYDRKFTIKDLYKKFKMQNYKNEMNNLKSFLELTSEYGKKIVDGEDIDSIFKDMAKKNCLLHISIDGNYYYNYKEAKRRKRTIMYPCDVKEIEKQIYAMSYAYAKMNSDIQPETEIINKKIMEMKKR